jgi:hypothetical protein
MLRSTQPLQSLQTLLAGWINRRQLDAIDYLKEENRLLKECLGGRRLRFPDAERRRLARSAYALGRKALSELDGGHAGYADVVVSNIGRTDASATTVGNECRQFWALTLA